MTFPKAIVCVLAGGVMLLASGAYQKAQAQSWGVYNRIGKQTPRNYKEPCWSAASSKCAREQSVKPNRPIPILQPMPR
jgi:hypothetical protein